MPELFSWKFFDSNALQTLTIFTTAFFVFVAHRLNEVSKIRTAATIILSQIDRIEDNVAYLKQHCVFKGIVNEINIYESKPILTINELNIHGAVITKFFDNSEYMKLVNFYDSAERISRMQKEIRDFIYAGLAFKAQNYAMYSYKSALETNTSLIKRKLTLDDINLKLNETRKLFDSFHVQTYLPIHHGTFIERYINEYYPLSGTTTFATLKKLSQKKI